MSVSIYCPHCHKHTALSPAPVKWKYSGHEGTTGAFWEKNGRETWWIGVCNACRNPVLVLDSGVRVYPAPIPEPTSEDVPETIRADLNEAKLCFSLAAYRACAVMARRAMQAAAIEKGATADKLVQQIEQLYSAGKITAEVKDWANAVRWVGNDAAHPNGSEVNKDDASDVLQLAEQFLHILYVSPALAAKLRAKLGKRQTVPERQTVPRQTVPGTIPENTDAGE